eukprot:TRINITY_DN9884_c0_g1_i2.p1 TRINITY_DN9884_c0_g1~~TRINITY_DN9884_c0_g1_i2.p1  ORF type:complete len:211 (-),score=44.69 TRINITY_DN9884_c0_g1_i2:46-678(-)
MWIKDRNRFYPLQIISTKGWKWNPSVTGKHAKILTDPKKQFLTSNARSSQRIKDIMKEQLVEQETDGWVLSNEAKVETSQQKMEMKQDEGQYRIYDLSITYDEYYHCPRLWISGVSETGKPLSDKEIFEDIMNEYINETVTVMEHPHLGIRQLSIHPCKHSDVMKKFIKKAEENGGKIEPHQALFIFLKFMSSVIPTVEYDATVDVKLSF